MLLSIIIPCYNSGGFLKNTLESFLSQDLRNCELVFINDGSDDNTLTILNEYKNRFDDLQIINQINKGVSAARNAGIENAHGDYLYFFDSDDIIANDAICFIKQCIMNHQNCDIFYFGFKIVNNGNLVKIHAYNYFNDKVFNGHNLLGFFFEKKIVLNICASVFKKEIVKSNQLRFKEGQKIGEDLLFNIEALIKSNLCYYSSYVVFSYSLRCNSATNGGTSYSINSFEAFEAIYTTLPNIPAAIINEKNYFIIFYYYSNLIQYLKNNGRRNFSVEKLFIKYYDIIKKIKFNGTFKYKYLIRIIRLIPPKFLFLLKK